ncbi:protein ZBED8 [Tachysurus ichikawai]
MVSAVCSDGAPVMLGRKSGFGALVKADAPHIIVTHCILHRHALATKTLPPTLAEVLKIVVECVNYVRNSALRHRIFNAWRWSQHHRSGRKRKVFSKKATVMETTNRER